jgi:hypothetical protein
MATDAGEEVEGEDPTEGGREGGREGGKEGGAPPPLSHCLCEEVQEYEEMTLAEIMMGKGS